jgi:hypothetical protein
VTNTALLESLINDSGLKRAFIAEKLGITRQALYKKITGLVQFTGPEIKTLCDLLNLKTWPKIKPVFFADVVIKNDYNAE